MNDVELLFKDLRADVNKLRGFGFIEKGGAFIYEHPLLDGEFRLTVTVRQNKVSTEVIDCTADEPYILIHVPGASGAFIGKIRGEYYAILTEIADKCFNKEVFQSDDARAVIQHIAEKYQDFPEFLWEKFSENAVFRRKDTSKWYAALLKLSRRKLGFDSDEIIDILDLRAEPSQIDSLVDGTKYFPGYHMNKKHWLTVCLDGSVAVKEIFEKIDASYLLAKK